MCAGARAAAADARSGIDETFCGQGLFHALQHMEDHRRYACKQNEATPPVVGRKSIGVAAAGSTILVSLDFVLTMTGC